MKTKCLFLFIALLSMFFSCASSQVNIPEDTPPAKIIQRAQEAADINRYKTALQCYQILLQRHGHQGEYLAVGEYEIAFIHYKQKRYSNARQGFEILLARYNQTDNGLPPQFKALSERMLKRLSELGY